MTKKGVHRKETWWWNAEISDAVAKKRKAWKVWKWGGSEEEYLQLKRAAKHAVYSVKRDAEDSKFKELDDKTSDVFRLAKSMKQQNAHVIGEVCEK